MMEIKAVGPVIVKFQDILIMKLEIVCTLTVKNTLIIKNLKSKYSTTNNTNLSFLLTALLNKIQTMFLLMTIQTLA